jgi:hypothetical protein
MESPLQTLELINNPLERGYAQQRVAIAQAERDLIETAKETMAAIKSDAELHIEPLGALGAAQVRTGDVAAARQTVATLLGMVNKLQTVQGGYAQMNALRAIAVAFVKAGRLSDAMETIASIEGLMYRSPALQEIALT